MSRPVRGRSSRDDAVVVVREPLRFLQPLSPAGRAAAPVRSARTFAVVRRDHLLRRGGHLVHRAISEVDQFLRMAEREARARARLAGIGRRRGITMAERVIIAAYAMAPFQPPLPTPRNLPFHFEAGIQTSILISESGVGFSVAATRHIAARDFTSSRAGPGSARAPGPTGCTSVTSPPFRRSEARRSHAAASGTGTCAIAAATTAHNPTPTDTAPILRPSDLLALRILPACSRTNVHVTRRIRFRQCNGGSRTDRASRPRLPHGRIRIGRRARRRVEGIESLSDAFGEPLEELEHGHSCITTAAARASRSGFRLMALGFRRALPTLAFGRAAVLFTSCCPHTLARLSQQA